MITSFKISSEIVFIFININMYKAQKISNYCVLKKL